MPITKLGGMTAGLQGGMALINNFEDIKTANLQRQALSQENAMNQLKLDEARKQQELLDRPIPLSVLESQIGQQYPEWWKHAKESAVSSQLISTNSAGIEYITPRNINTFMGMLDQQGELGMKSLKSMTVDLNNRLLQTQQAMQTAKKPEEQQALKQQYKSITDQLSSVVSAMNSMDDKVRQQTAVAEAQKSERVPASRFVKYINPSNPSQSKDINIGVGETPPEGWMDFMVWKEQRRGLGKGPGGSTSAMNQESFALLSPEEKESAFQDYMLTKKQPYSLRSKDNATFQKEYRGWLKTKMTGTDATLVKREFESLGKSLDIQNRSRGMMGGFVRNMDKQVQRVGEIYTSLVKRVGVRALDMPIRELKMRVKGSGNEQIVNSYLTEISNEIGKISTGSQASIRELSVEAQERWSKIHDPNLSFNELKKILDETRHQGRLRLDSSDEEISFTKSLMSDVGKINKTKKFEAPTTSAPSTPTVSNW